MSDWYVGFGTQTEKICERCRTLYSNTFYDFIQMISVAKKGRRVFAFIIEIEKMNPDAMRVPSKAMSRHKKEQKKCTWNRV